ncbi:MAG: hypothetical protein AMS18_06550 [Gemmatimonas sp. SG8_17]|nr:MAG: hypothetical protein AMS18_06550 [Gemmatimonas sp. SG8_17]
MTVDPVNQGQVSPSGANRTHEAKAKQQPGPVGSKTPDNVESVTDSVELSSAAQELHDVAGSGGPESNTLPIERLQEVLQRISDGFYDRPDVVDEVAKRVSDDV